MDKFRRVWTKKIENPKIAENYLNNYFITVLQYSYVKTCPKEVIYDQFDEKTNPPLQSNFFVSQLGSFLISKLKSVEKTAWKNTPILLFFEFGSKTNEFGRVWTEKIGIWRKSVKCQKVLEIFSKTFCFSDLCCQTKIWKKNPEKGQ